MEFYPLGNTPVKSLFPILQKFSMKGSGEHPSAEVSYKQVQKQLKDQLKLKSKIRYPPLQKQNLIAEDKVLEKVCKFYGKTYGGTDPVSDTISTYESDRKKEYNVIEENGTFVKKKASDEDEIKDPYDVFGHGV